jgi:hypothetical protein
MKWIVKPFSRILLILAVGALSLALTVEYASLEELAIESHVIVHGKIKNTRSVWEGNNIYTYSMVDIIQSVKGNLIGKQSITIKQLGGTVGDIGAEVNGSPKLKEGTEVFLFLVDWKNNYWIHSIILGYYEVVERNGEKLAVNNFNNVHLIDPVTKRPMEDIKHIKTNYELNSLVSDIKQILVKEKSDE